MMWAETMRARADCGGTVDAIGRTGWWASGLAEVIAIERFAIRLTIRRRLVLLQAGW